MKNLPIYIPSFEGDIEVAFDFTPHVPAYTRYDRRGLPSDRFDAEPAVVEVHEITFYTPARPLGVTAHYDRLPSSWREQVEASIERKMERMAA